MPSNGIVRWNPLASGSTALNTNDKTVIAIGIFDGLHIGHQALLGDALADAHRRGCPFVVVTFERDPDEVFRPDGHFKLCTNEKRLGMIASFCEAPIIALPATSEVFGMQPGEFLDALGVACNPAAIHVGRDFRFGFQASGTVEDIVTWSARNECECQPHSLVEAQGAVVTATRIRALLQDGAVAQAAQLLGGRYHALCGTVTRGRGEGTGFGFATANLDLSQNEVLLPREGVYGGYARVEGTRYPAAINMGKAISFKEATAPLEAHLLGFEGDLYGKEVEVSFVEWLRAPRVFESKEELISTVMGNIDWVRQNLGGGPLGTD